MIDGDWAVPRSLAATQGISVDFYSSGYLDVSVHQVCNSNKFELSNLQLDRLPHSEIYGSNRMCQSP